MTLKIQFFPLEFSYETNNEGKAVIEIFGKTKDNKKIIAIDDNFDPYFYAVLNKNINPNKIIERIKKLKFEKEEKEIYVKDVILEKKNFLAKLVDALKIIVNHPSSVIEMRYIVKELNGIEDVKESDISFYKRYLIDKKLIPLQICNIEGELAENTKQGVDFTIKINKIEQGDETFHPKVLAFDIEAYTEEKRYPVDIKDPIIMVAFAGSDGFKKVITWKKFPNAKDYIEFVDDEEDLIDKFLDTVKKYDPDYITGYFSDGFDFPYIYTRAKKYNTKLNLNTGSLKVNKRGNNTTAKIEGLTHIDIFKFIRNIMSSGLRLESYDLGEVAKELLGEKKIETDLATINVIMNDQTDKIAEYCEYNLKDAELTLKLCEKLLPNINELVKLIGQPIYDISRMTYGRLVENYLMRRAPEFNEIYPNKPTQAEISVRRLHTYQGAFVFEPKPGLYENVVVMDYRSLYPSIISAHNIDPSNLTDDRKESNATPEITLESGKKIRYYFSYKKEGFIPNVVRDVILRRIRIKELIKNEAEKNPILEARSYALKTTANAMYGYYAFFGARWYSRECAESITAYGREYVKDVIDKTNKFGFDVVYSDTDAVAFTLGNKTKKDVFDFLDSINRDLPSLMELELEDFYKRGIFVMKKGEERGAKKKYALISEKGDIKVIGFETVRRDWSYIAREVQRNVIEIILRENSKEKAFDYVKEIIEKIKAKKIRLDKMIIQTQLRKSIESYDLVGPHVIIAKKMVEKGMFVSPGVVVQYIVTEGKGMIRDKVKLPEDCNKDEYDANYYINNQVIPSVSRIFSALGYTENDLLEDKEQSKLKRFL